MSVRQHEVSFKQQSELGKYLQYCPHGSFQESLNCFDDKNMQI